MKKQLKSLLCLLIAATMLLSLSSCGKGKGADSEEESGKKVILILVDGMRPDAMEQCGNKYFGELKKKCAYTLNAQTVWPSKTLPAHLSLFYSIPPEKHGTTSNEKFVPHPTSEPADNGLFERLRLLDKKSCMYYSWEPLKNVTGPESEALTVSELLRYQDFQDQDEDKLITKRALNGIKEVNPDFAFIYIGSTDSTGHREGWMSDAYLERVDAALDRIKTIMDKTKGEYTIIITADHGGHDKTHGNDIPEDMTIPLFIYDKDIKPGKISGDVSILDIAPTIAEFMDFAAPESWEGKSLVSRIKK